MSKLKILVNAYACSPNRGSEPGMGWNWCVHLAKHCDLYIITEEEFRENIEQALSALPQGKNMHFYYNAIPEKVREMCRNQGDWRFYGHYDNWQKETLNIAKKIISQIKIDIIHQLNMIGFREPGYLWKIEHIPFIWGPIGGLKQFPVAYLKGSGLKMKLFNRLKNQINILQLKYHPRVNSALQNADFLISSIPDSYNAIKKHKNKESVLIPETGCFITDNISTERFHHDDFQVMWVGKFDFRKQLPLALKTIAAAKNKRIILNIYGKGNLAQENEAKKLVDDLGIKDQVIWHGNQPNSVVQKAMQEAHLYFFTSVSEDTSTVVLEALSNRLPVLCFDACGFGAIINDKVGRKVSLSNPQKSVQDFAEQLNYFCNNRDLLKELSQNCEQMQKELSWDEKALKVLNIYHKVLTNRNK